MEKRMKRKVRRDADRRAARCPPRRREWTLRTSCGPAEHERLCRKTSPKIREPWLMSSCAVCGVARPGHGLSKNGRCN